MNIYIALFCLTVVIGAVIIWNLYPSRKRLSRFHEREELTSDQIYERFFSNELCSKDLVLELWNEVASVLGIPPGKLRLTDRFDKELAPEKGWEYDDEIGIINSIAQTRLKKSGTTANFSGIKTLGDYVHLFCDVSLKNKPTTENHDQKGK
jgi:hypothetical protein